MVKGLPEGAPANVGLAEIFGYGGLLDKAVDLVRFVDSELRRDSCSDVQRLEHGHGLIVRREVLLIMEFSSWKIAC